MDDSLITLENLSVGYDNQPVLSGISLSLARAGYIALLGANGSGKSTLLKTLVGLLPPIAGHIQINAPANSPVLFGYVPQSIQLDSLYPLTGFDVALMGVYRRWVNQTRQGRQPKKSGRPRVSQEISNLVVRIGRENILWGYRRIVGEMRKLGYAVCASTVKRILLDEGIHPTPEKNQRRQPPMPWGQFIAAHMDSLVAIDFFTKTVYTWRGRFDAFVFVVLHLGMRRVLCSPATFNPDEKWVMQQARNVAMWMQERASRPAGF